MNLVLQKPIKSWVQVTQSCNLRCKQCYGDCHAEQAAGELTDDEYISLIKEMASEGVIDILVEGGEPLNRPGIVPLLSHFADYVMTRLRTNGTMLDRDTARRLKEGGVGQIFVDLLGATQDVHDWHIGVPGSFDRAVAGVRNAIAAGDRTVILMIMTKQNVHQLQDVINLAAGLGVDRVGILRLYPLGRARTNWPDLALPLPEQMAALNALSVPDGIHLMTSWHPKDGNCCWQNAGVDATGRVVGCAYLRDYVDYGNVREVSWMDTWNHPLYRQLRGGNVNDGCPECARTQGSRGGCRSTAYAFTGRWDSPDPFCTHTNGDVDVARLPAHLEQLRIQPRPADATRNRLLPG
jgi:radical SAM protein with 4Fe4S-binding SPASM domain